MQCLLSAVRGNANIFYEFCLKPARNKEPNGLALIDNSYKGFIQCNFSVCTSVYINSIEKKAQEQGWNIDRIGTIISFSWSMRTRITTSCVSH